MDTGHLLGNLELSGSISDFRPHLIGGFADEAVNQLLYLDAEKEGAIAVLALADLLEVKQNLPLTRTALPSPPQLSYPSLPDGALLSYLHRVTSIPPVQPPKQTSTAIVPVPKPGEVLPDKYNFPFCLKISTAIEPIDWGEELAELEPPC
ncbi:MAG: hypothetical protein HC881_22150 [Leptolyngbyaceae cyanobacterium SL_7_1]|nr:hypothetical protein [Leptolyngbyaceae cyanobacterium SL_7_1]